MDFSYRKGRIENWRSKEIECWKGGVILKVAWAEVWTFWTISLFTWSKRT